MALIDPPVVDRAARRHRWDTKFAPYGYVAPYFLIFGVFGLFPLLYTIWVSLQHRNLLDEGGAYLVWFDNYSALFADPYFWNSMGNTLSLWLLTTVPQILFALGIAALLNRKVRTRTLFRMGVILPNITSVAAVTIIFAQLFGRDFGLVNWVLDLFGAGQIDWQAGTATSHVAIAVMVVWRWTGYHALIFLASMQAISPSLYEAATLDGANGWQQFWRITVPLLRPQIIFTTIIATTGNMRLLAEPLLFNPGAAAATGGSDRQFQTAALYLYEQGFTKYDFGYSSAIAVVLAIATVIVAGFGYLVTKRIQTE
ncbi:sugar ABC transporter permease [Lentzea sp.]|uniref:carbohydrate ABC transporter permease n=1 Tax=Lentzea sp. TaxID=56099 RepID=UPI002B8B9B22|nr:sugar ABC transporter permease [Lentzea sp.]HUQ61624.1 sugar ABC transporter permease [Lentzea sp.]